VVTSPSLARGEPLRLLAEFFKGRAWPWAIGADRVTGHFALRDSRALFQE
jgi:hypothetical protein